MWFVLGLVSLALVVGYKLYRKLHWAWGWTDDLGVFRHQGQRYKFDHQENKGSHQVKFGVVTDQPVYFRIKRESRWDRLAKRLHLSVEQQFNDPEFDETFYVVSNHPALTLELAKIPALRNVLKALFRDPKLWQLWAEGRHLVAEYRFSRGDVAEGHYEHSETKGNIVSALHELAGFLQTTDHPTPRDPYAWRAIVLVSLASGLLGLGIFELIRVGKLDSLDPLLDSWPLIHQSLAATGLLLFLWLVWAAFWLRGSAHAHIVMTEILLSGGAGLLLGTYFMARDFNCEWDPEPAAIYYADVLAREYQNNSKSPDTYSLTIRHRGIGWLPETIPVRGGVYALAREGGQVELLIKPGRLGHAWLEQVRVIRDY